MVGVLTVLTQMLEGLYLQGSRGWLAALRTLKANRGTQLPTFLQREHSFAYNVQSWPGSSVGRAED